MGRISCSCLIRMSQQRVYAYIIHGTIRMTLTVELRSEKYIRVLKHTWMSVPRSCHTLRPNAFSQNPLTRAQEISHQHHWIYPGPLVDCLCTVAHLVDCTEDMAASAWYRGRRIHHFPPWIYFVALFVVLYTCPPSDRMEIVWGSNLYCPRGHAIKLGKPQWIGTKDSLHRHRIPRSA